MNRIFFTPAFAGPVPGGRRGVPFGGPAAGPWARKAAAAAAFRARRAAVMAHVPDDDEPDGHPGHPGHHGPGHGPGHGRRGGRGFGPGFGPGPFGPGRGFGPGSGGFGPGGPGFGPGGPGFGPGGPGGPGGRGGRGPWRRRRGNVRAAILALLAEEPRHGYAIMTELAGRSGGLWRPSPGSVYPVLAQLQDEGLVSADDVEGRKVFALTEAGRAHVAENAEELREPWVVADDRPRVRVQQLMQGMAALGAAVEQVARLGGDAQSDKAVAALDEARRTMYRILAGDDTGDGPGRPAAEPDASSPEDGEG